MSGVFPDTTFTGVLSIEKPLGYTCLSVATCLQHDPKSGLSTFAGNVSLILLFPTLFCFARVLTMSHPTSSPS